MTSTIIVGAGLAGLYYALTCKENNILILEQSDRIGGRIGQVDFHGVDVVYGAGIGRYDKDLLLRNLLQQLQVEYKIYNTQISYILPKVVDILKILKYLQKEYYKDPSIRSKATFLEFLGMHMDKTDVYNWICSTGYSDYLNADIYDTMFDYGFEDNVGGYKAMSIPWNKLLEKILLKLTDKNVEINLNSEVIGIKKYENTTVVNTSGGDVYKCRKLILAIPSPSIRKLLKNPIYDQVRVQTFCRLYIKIDKKKSQDFVKNVTNFTFVEPPLQKIIPWTEKGVYMISYSDNKSADYVKDLNDTQLEDLVYTTTRYRIKILDRLVFYFPVGTHYYSPLDTNIYKDRLEFLHQAQNPDKNIYVVGEGFSLNQGWCEGALESVRRVLK